MVEGAETTPTVVAVATISQDAAITKENGLARSRSPRAAAEAGAEEAAEEEIPMGAPPANRARKSKKQGTPQRVRRQRLAGGRRKGRKC